MTTPKTKTKATKTQVEKHSKEYIGIVQILAEMQEETEDNGNVLDNHSDVLQDIQDNQGILFSNDEILANKLNAIFRMSAIGIGVAITFAFIAIFCH